MKWLQTDWRTDVVTYSHVHATTKHLQISYLQDLFQLDLGEALSRKGRRNYGFRISDAIREADQNRNRNPLQSAANTLNQLKMAVAPN